MVSEMDNQSDVIDDIQFQILQLKSSREWNPRAKFLIILLNVQDFASEEIQKNLSRKILTVLWSWKVINVVILMECEQHNFIFEKNDSLVNIYTWFPYNDSNNCEDVTNVILMDNWTVDQKFRLGTTLFPNKVSDNLHGCPLKISSFNFEPMIIGMEDKEDGTVDFKGGLEIEMVKMFANSANMSIVFRVPTPENQHWGVKFDNGTWTGLPGEVLSHHTDMTIVNFWYKCHLINEFECLRPHMIDAARWFVPCAKPYPRWMSITRVFNKSLWIGFILSYIIISFFMSFMVKLVNTFLPREHHSKEYSGVIHCLLNFWAIILEESATNNPPRNSSLRTIFLTWVMFCWAMNTVYQTFLTSFLVDPGLQKQLSSEDDILDSKIRYVIFKVITFLLPHLASDRYRRGEDRPDFMACFDQMAFKGDLALVFSTQRLGYIIAASYMDGDGKPLICSFEEIITNQMISIHIIKGFPMVDKFNKLVGKIVDAGL
ncbi:hypothetical protein L9F63_015505 [Diploptera punctata]|uniref:Ionotropic glutamate receptor L-glutamate and glycine-binding domain-containing protein n=1 Tax=Diploptera punctata TaxID=6984 RepID=A0AAD8EK16_DIPPU|nr:hypothetical protein L9F63_015505 [Diploptera punctata]